MTEFFFFLSGILFVWLYQRITLALAWKLLKRRGQLGHDTRTKFVRELTQSQLESLDEIIDAEIAKRELM